MKPTSPVNSDPSPFWGLFWAAITGTVLGLCSQLFYLSYVSLEDPLWRLWLGPLGGALGGMLMVFAAAWLLSKLSRLPQASSVKLAGWGLLAAGLLLVPFWYAISSADAYWLLLALWVLAMAALYPLARPQHQPAGAKSLQKLIPLMVSLVVIGGLLLRLSGVNYGLPDLIPHSDTPKQIKLLHYFMQGNLMAHDYYPVGHIYLYAALLQLFWFLAPLAGQPPLLMIDSMAEAANLTIAARSLSACLSAAIPLIGYFAARRLWGAWAGLAAALLLALDPVHLTYSRQAMGDVPQTFWVMFSFYFSVRLFQEKRWWDCLLAGLFAGFAVSCKVYGGYILAASFAAWLLASPRKVWMPMLLLLGLVLGTAINTPYIFIDFNAWYENITYLSAEQYGVGYDRTIWMGLSYSFWGLLHRFNLLWLLASAAGLVFLLKRHRKEDLLFLVPALLSIVFIYGFRLRYLREWDFVNLTIYYNLAAAVFLGVFLSWSLKRKVWNKLAPILIGLFLVLQSWTALSDAWIARQSDTRLSAKSWLACLTRPGERILAAMSFSGAFTDWCVENGPCTKDRQISAQLAEGRIPAKASALVLENGWGDPSAPREPLKPLLDIKIRHTHWEHPREAIYRPDSPGYTGKVALPLFRENPRRYAFWNTGFGRSLPAELVNLPNRRHLDAFAQDQPLDWVGYLALGQGQGRLSLGPGLSLAIQSNPNQPDAGMAYLLRSPLPLLPRTYQVGLDWSENAPAWVGVFPQPQGMLPMLMRLGAWSKAELVSREAWQRDHSPEAGLILAAALVKRGQTGEAAQILKELNSRYPDFMDNYQGLADKTGSDLMTALSKMTGLGPAVLTWRRVVWPGQDGWWGDKCQAGLDPAQQELLERKHHVWLTNEFLPGFIRMRAQIAPAQTGRIIKIVAHRPGVLVADIAKAKIQPGQAEVELTGQVAAGPVRLEIILESDDPDQPRLRRVELLPDLAAEFAWRWQVIKEQLGGLAD